MKKETTPPFNVEQKKQIYSQMITILKSNSFVGLCWAATCGIEKLDRYNFNICGNKGLLPELFTPWRIFWYDKVLGKRYDFWFPLSDKGNNKRIKMVKEALGKLK